MKKTIIFENQFTLKMRKYLLLSFVGIVTIFTLMFATLASAATLNRDLQLGMSGSDVTSLQTFLAKDSTIYPQGLVTGYFGQLTKAAVERFQTIKGIVTSGTPATTGYGRVGPVTRQAINQSMSNVGVGGDLSSSPSINSITINTTSNSASINWNTNENSSAIIYYSTFPIPMTEASPTTGVQIGGSSKLVNTDMRSSHSVIVDSLSSNTTYYYVIYARDVNGNESITWPDTFRTN